MGAIAGVATLPRAAAVLEQAGAENFPVASRLLSRRDREHLMALYGYARLVDDTGDEAAGDRAALLDELEAELDRIYAGAEPRHALTRRLRDAVEACDLPRAPLQALIEANRQDQVVHDYATFDELLRYGELSANPVGRLVLHVFAAATPERIERSDRVCTALQLAEHCQDVAEDLARGRVYLPAEDRERFGVSIEDLRRSPAPERVRTLLAFEVARGREILAAGAPLVGTLRGRRRLAVAAFVAGGRAAFAAIQRAGCDVSAGPPRATRAARGRELLGVLAGRSGR
ncbi:MAG TPA: squalene synthase HpnC [Solirubrobacteraceae bacterium]